MDNVQEQKSGKGRYTVRLGNLSKTEAGSAGTKASNLGEMMSAGFLVPDGFAVTTEAFDRFLSANDLTYESSMEKVMSASVPLDVAGAIKSALEELGKGPFAVRSSGVAEDLPDASYAGQYETLLNVQGDASIISAIHQCWGSAFNENILAYRRAHDQLKTAGMAVLVQCLIKADVAGVAFSANPVTGDRKEVVVSAVKGLGERLVSGEASPDEWLVRETGAVCQRAPEGALDASLAQEVADLARDVESYFGLPQDIEWAAAEGKLYMLQARPITALPQKPELPVPKEGFWFKDDVHFSSPVTPFGASVYLPAMDNGAAVAFEEFGLPIEGTESISVGGEIYGQIIPLGGKGKKGPAPPAWVLFLAMRLVPSIRRRRKIAENAVRSQLMDRIIESWYSEWRDQFRQKSRHFLGIDLSKLDDQELLGHLDSSIDFLRWGEVVHFRLMIPYLIRNYELAAVCEELFGWDAAQAMLLVSGTSETSSEPGRRLVELAKMAGQYPAAKEIISDGQNVLFRLRETEPDVFQAFDAYLNEFGHRTANYEPGSPTLAEKPELLAGLLRDRMFGTAQAEVIDPGEVSKQAFNRAQKELETRPPDERRRFEKILEAARHVNPVREDNVFYTDNVPAAIIRYALLEIGGRLVSRNIIDDRLDAAYLEDAELRAALQGEEKEFKALVQSRKSELAWVSTHPGPKSYGKDPGPPPDPRIMPEPWRSMAKAQFWFLDVGFTGSPPASSQKELRGVPGSPGRYTGAARIIHNEAGFSRLLPGDVLVCPVTTPAWSILFSQAGAVVTNGGGILSHAAIIARENGIPAVLGTINGTQILTDGQTVTVDGGKGVVELLAAK